MKRVNLTNKAIILLTALSTIYAILEMNIVFLSPIITIAIPYTFMKYREELKYRENKKILTNLFLFNLLSFISISIIMDHMNENMLDMIVNIFISFIYYKLLCVLETKQEKKYITPQAVYESLNKKVYMLEQLRIRIESEMEKAKTEKDKNSIKLKIDTIDQKINQYKSQLEIIKIKIDSKNDDLIQ